MLKKALFALCALCSTTLFADEEPAFSMENVDIDKVSQAIGHLMARQLKNPGIEFDLDKMIEGMQMAKKGEPAPLSDQEVQQTLANIQEHVFLEMAHENLKKADSFLEENKSHEGIVALEEKLQYKVLKEGSGHVVSQESTPLIHYSGALLDGTVFASSEEHQEPIALPLQQTIPGFSKGLVGMKEGEKRTFYIHPELAYGIAGNLPPNSLLIFDVEVVQANSAMAEIAKQEPPPTLEQN